MTVILMFSGLNCIKKDVKNRVFKTEPQKNG